MRIVLNTRSDDAASAAAIVGLGKRLQRAGADATIGDWSGYARYDVAVFLGYDHELERARREQPRIRVVLADPKLSRREWIEAARAADLLLVSSVEQREAFLPVNRNIVVFQMFPPLPERQPRSRGGGPVIIGYHGNRVHLEAMAETVTPALEALARDREIEFRAIYNRSALGCAELGLPRLPVGKVREVQWDPVEEPGTGVSRALLRELAEVDIGVVPSLLPVAGGLRALLRTAKPDPRLMYEPFDHLLRFKASTNAGRVFPFARLGIPVVADPTPSNAQFVRDGETGLLAAGPHGWYEALLQLVDDADLAARLGRQLQREVGEHYEGQVATVLDALSRPAAGPPLPFEGPPTPEERLAIAGRFPSPSRPLRRSALNRLARLVRRA
ncbi:MAG TPA: glycosyltransferase [Gaiellaceae bacterium]|nr:glycosyltransferase [Gaiellaceae bacterium]